MNRANGFGGGYLADKSAMARFKLGTVAERLTRLRSEGRLYSCAIVDLEILFSTRGATEYQAVREERRVGFPRAPINDRTLDRALEVQALLAEQGLHRAVSIPDLLIAAAAEQSDLAVLHCDRDFDRIAAVTDQPAEWIIDPVELS